MDVAVSKVTLGDPAFTWQMPVLGGVSCWQRGDIQRGALLLRSAPAGTTTTDRSTQHWPMSLSARKIEARSLRVPVFAAAQLDPNSPPFGISADLNAVVSRNPELPLLHPRFPNSYLVTHVSYFVFRILSFVFHISYFVFWISHLAFRARFSPRTAPNHTLSFPSSP